MKSWAKCYVGAVLVGKEDNPLKWTTRMHYLQRETTPGENFY